MDHQIFNDSHFRYLILHTFCIYIINVFLHTTAISQSKASFSVETDPLIFVLQGYGGHMKVNHEALEHWEFGVGGGFSATLPDAFNDMNKNNKDQGWSVKMIKAVGLFSEYYFQTSRRGWFVGSQAMFQKYRIKNSAIGLEHSDFTTFVIMAHTGYRWFPFKNGFYARPWLGIGYQTKNQGSVNLGEKTYDIFKILPFTAVHLGYQF